MTTIPTLRDVRRAKGLTLEQLAALCLIPAGNLSRIERGAEFPRPARASRLARSLDLPLPQVYAAIAAADANSNASNATQSPELGKDVLTGETTEVK